MKTAAAISKLVLFFAVMSLGALVMYFWTIGTATASIANACGDNRGAVTISITKYNLVTNVNCFDS